MPARQRAIGVPVELGIVVGVQIDGARSYDAAAGLDLFGPSGGDLPADFGYPSVLDSHVGPIPGYSGAVYKATTTNNQVIFAHPRTSLCSSLRMGFALV